MGAMKDLMLERKESKAQNLRISFQCPHCLHFTAGDIRIPGDESSYSGEIFCLNDECERVFTIDVERGSRGFSAEISNMSDVSVNVDVDRAPEFEEDDFWDEPLPEPGAYEIFKDAMVEWHLNLSVIGQSQGDSSRNRMLFTTLYSILEAYLSDTVIGVAMTDKDVQKHIIKLADKPETKGLPGIKGVNFTMEKVLENPEIVRDTIKNSLQSVSFHNIELVNAICKGAFPNELLPKDPSDRALIIKSVPKRHDCVHRNGVDKAGVRCDDITNDYLRRLGLIFGKMVDDLETTMVDASVMKFLEPFD